MLERVVGWGTVEIRSLFESYGLTLHEWEKARTDRVIVRESAPVLSRVEGPALSTVEGSALNEGSIQAVA